MRKTKLMELTEKFSSNKKTMYADTSAVDPTIYMLCDLAESQYGGNFITNLAEDIIYTQCGANRTRTLEFIVNLFVREHVMRVFGKYKKDLSELPEIKEDTHMDYFVAFMQMERDARGTGLEKASLKLQPILFGITSQSPYQVCQNIVEFFEATDDGQYQLFLLIHKTCVFLKAEAAMEDDE